MDLIKTDVVHSYLRELRTKRWMLASCFFSIAIISLAYIYIMPRNYSASSAIYADDGNILRPLMAGTAVTTDIEDQARMAQEILFKQEFNDEILQAAGYNLQGLSLLDKAGLIDGIKTNTVIDNIVLGRSNLVTITNTSNDPLNAYNLVEKYTSLFIEQSTAMKQEESRNAYEFIQNEAASYLSQLEIAEGRLNDFRLENNEGTLASANQRVANYQGRIETLQLASNQLESEEKSVEAVLAGEEEIVQDLSEVNAVRARISALQINLDNLRASYTEIYPGVVQLKAQIAELNSLLDSGQTSGFIGPETTGNNQGISTLQQELRSQLATIKTNKDANQSQINSLQVLLDNELEKVDRITSTEAELAELTRDHNITLQFYNNMLSTMENARISMHLDEQQKGVRFVIQEPPVIPLEANGIQFYQLLISSFIFAIGVPIGLLILFVEFDPRIRNEGDWSEDWPPLLMVVPSLKTIRPQAISNKSFVTIMVILALSLYIGTLVLKIMNFNPETVLGMF